LPSRRRALAGFRLKVGMTEVWIHFPEFQLFCHIPTKKDRPEGRLKKTALSGGYRRLCKGMQWENDPMEWSIRRGYAAKDIAPY
jgi:hypothetical protein